MRKMIKTFLCGCRAFMFYKERFLLTAYKTKAISPKGPLQNYLLYKKSTREYSLLPKKALWTSRLVLGALKDQLLREERIHCLIPAETQRKFTLIKSSSIFRWYKQKEIDILRETISLFFKLNIIVIFFKH